MPSKTPKAKQGARGKLIAIASGKGGVGKTWLSITLSHALVKEGKKVLLFDGDLGLANIDVQLGLMTRRDIADVIEGSLRMENAVQKHEETGIDVLAGRSGHGALSTLPLPRLAEAVDELRHLTEKYDAVIVDLGAGIDRTVRYITAAADAAIVVTTDEPTALTDAYALVKLSHAAGHAQNLHIVVNMSGSEKEGTATHATLSKACKNFLKFSPPLLGIVRQDKRVRDAIRAQSPFLSRSPTSDTAGDVLALAKTVAKDILA